MALESGRNKLGFRFNIAKLPGCLVHLSRPDGTIGQVDECDVALVAQVLMCHAGGIRLHFSGEALEFRLLPGVQNESCCDNRDHELKARRDDQTPDEPSVTA